MLPTSFATWYPNHTSYNICAHINYIKKCAMMQPLHIVAHIGYAPYMGFFDTKTGHSQTRKNLWSWDRPPQKNVTIHVAGVVKKSVRRGRTEWGTKRAVERFNSDYRVVRCENSLSEWRVYPPIFWGESLLKSIGCRWRI